MPLDSGSDLCWPDCLEESEPTASELDGLAAGNAQSRPLSLNQTGFLPTLDTWRLPTTGPVCPRTPR